MSAGNASNLKPFKMGHKKLGGRKLGVPNKFPRNVREAMLAAANILGYDGKGHGGLTGFFARYPQNLATQLGRLVTLPEIPPPDRKFWNFKLLSDDELRLFERLVMKIQVRLPPEDDTEASLQPSDSDPRNSQSLLQLLKRELVKANDGNEVMPVAKDREG